MTGSEGQLQVEVAKTDVGGNFVAWWGQKSWGLGGWAGKGAQDGGHTIQSSER